MCKKSDPKDNILYQLFDLYEICNRQTYRKRKQISVFLRLRAAMKLKNAYSLEGKL